MTSLSASWLTPPDNLLSANGFKLVDRQQVNFGLAHADLWRRKNPINSVYESGRLGGKPCLDWDFLIAFGAL
jgi:hypothetical protein